MTWLHVVLLIAAIVMAGIAVWQGILFGKDIAKKVKEKKQKQKQLDNPSDDGRKD